MPFDVQPTMDKWRAAQEAVTKASAKYAKSISINVHKSSRDMALRELKAALATVVKEERIYASDMKQYLIDRQEAKKSGVVT